ncbi:hypothetical protein J7T55_012320 [Diaporthe amygdali]|uniref:uncharacterized protein n=1 Tax=Phomopsis amygdali TaxID=1214568 RepID=UPI0022FEA0FC|nr:uncharacterized protein J7T55_012320 [Diaporthe amygdali]KAJ0123849.1 hypothetical protein J7T55_012320 [Diaporthe amygdali]
MSVSSRHNDVWSSAVESFWTTEFNVDHGRRLNKTSVGATLSPGSRLEVLSQEKSGIGGSTDVDANHRGYSNKTPIDAASSASSKTILTDENPSTEELLCGLQLKLLRVHRTFNSHRHGQSFASQIHDIAGTGLSGSEMCRVIDDTYTATEDLLNIMRSLCGAALDSTNGVSPAEAQTNSVHLQSSPAQPTRSSPVSSLEAATTLFLSSCYASLISAYEIIVETMKGQSTEDTSTLPWQLGPPSASARIPASGGSFPTFSMNNSRLAMPSSVNLGLHLHLISHMVQRLKDSMQMCCACHNIKGRNSPATALVQTASSELSLSQESLEDALRRAKIEVFR